ncbi:MAG: hypothetical protein J6M27_00075, partial [Lachnospiraceae bacterium]|nr:hypothetical protein [Lachnospiraceae bacterium]
MTRNDLESLLTSNIPDIQNKNLWIFGAGNTAVLYYNGLKRLETEGFFIQGYVDNNSAKWGTTFNDKTVISPEELKTLPDVCVLVCSIQKNVIVAVQNQLSEMGIINYRIDDVILKKHANEVLQCYDLFCDDDSKNAYAELVKARITGNDDVLPYSSKELYYAFKPFLLNSSNEVFIDCGAYVGDSMERYIWNKDGVFHKIYAFEPDSNNFLALQNRKKRLCLEWSGCREDNILTYPYGIAEASLYADVHHHQQTNGLSSHIELLKGEQSGKP